MARKFHAPVMNILPEVGGLWINKTQRCWVLVGKAQGPTVSTALTTILPTCLSLWRSQRLCCGCHYSSGYLLLSSTPRVSLVQAGISY